MFEFSCSTPTDDIFIVIQPNFNLRRTL
uniref:Uncharacterized protein n=1 Tax=Anguilla anguilla TaxID=7936 RepID=A0A0E9QUR1_ANGAN